VDTVCRRPKRRLQFRVDVLADSGSPVSRHRYCTFAPGYLDKPTIKAHPNLLKYARDLVSYMLSFMARFALLVLFFVHAVLGISLWERVSDGDFFNVTEGGGSWLDSGDGTLGEPLNVKRSSVAVPIMMSDRC
jgi:hypothetical protein